MNQLMCWIAAIDIWDYSNRYLGMQHLIIDSAANEIWGCSNQ